MSYTEINNLPELNMPFDFEKAFTFFVVFSLSDATFVWI